MLGIIVSWLDADARTSAAALRANLAEVFGDQRVFLQRETLPAQDDRRQIEDSLQHCQVALVVIGPQGSAVADETNRTHAQLADEARQREIALLLKRSDITVVPVLVGEAVLPRAEQLPADLCKLSECPARKIDDARSSRHADFSVLVRDIQSLEARQSSAELPATHPPDSTRPPRRIGWLRLDGTTLGGAFVLTLVAGMYAYLVNSPLDAPGILFLFTVFCVLIFAARWLWARFRSGRRSRT